MIARRILRPAVASLLMATTVAAALLPPVHIHILEDDHDHHHAAVEHAHWAGHFQSQPAIDDNDHDGRVLFVDRPALVRSTHAHIAPPPVAAIGFLTLQAPLESVGIGQRTAGNAVRDGPALLAFHLRGPPLVL